MKDNNKISIDYCVYGCGKKVYINPKIKFKIKLVEFDTGQLHDYPRCYSLLKEQGKDTNILKIKPWELRKK